MYYFDNQFLQSYLDLTDTIQVFVDGEILSITSKHDLHDTQVGVGSDEYGQQHTFSYPAITKLIAKGQTITVDQLQDKLKGDEQPPEGEEKPADKKDAPDGEQEGGEEDLTPSEEKPKEQEPEKEKEEPVKEQVKLHHFTEVSDRRSKYHGLKGVVRLIDNKGMVVEAYNVGSIWARGDMVTVDG